MKKDWQISTHVWLLTAFFFFLSFQNTAQNPPPEDSLRSQGKLLADKGRYQEAIQVFQSLLTLQSQQVPLDSLAIVSTYTLLGSTSFSQQDFRKAYYYFQQALAIQHKEYGPPSAKNIYLYINLASTCQKLKQYTKALTYSKRALLASPSKGSYYLHLNLEMSYFDTQQLDSALYHYQKALEFKNRPGVLFNIGDTYLKLGKPLIALKYYNQINLDALHFYSQVGLYYRKAKAFHAQVSLYKLTNTKKTKLETKALHSLQLTDSLIKHRQHILQNEEDKLVLGQWIQDITELGLNISHSLYKLAVRTTQKQYWQDWVFYFGERQKANVLLDDLTESTSITITQLPQIQEKLQTTDAVLHYSFGKDSLYMFAITKERITLKTLPKDSIQKHWRAYNLYLHVPIIKKCIRYMHQFYRWLVAPMYPIIGNKKRWLVIGGVLNVLPFDTFCEYQGADPRKIALISIDFQQFPYLIKKHTIRYAPSATLAFLKEPLPHYNRQFVGVAPGIYKDTVKVPTLKHAQKEVKTIARTTGNKSGILLGRAATRQNIMQEATKARWLHFATHGVTNDQVDLNGLQLYEDSWLVKDFKGLKLYNELVVLSSCSAISGKFVPGEGRLAMPRSFLRAGVRNILYTLWSVNDRLAARLMTSFYKYFMQKKDYAEALRQAKLEFLRDPKPVYGYPGLWGVFLLEGRF